MNTIYKYPFALSDNPTIQMPAGAVLLHVAHQYPNDPHLCLWALVDPTKAEVTRQLAVYGTGQQPAADDREFVGTVLMYAFVWHVFDRGEVQA